MKKQGMAMMLAAALAMGALAGCGSAASSDADTTAEATEASADAEASEGAAAAEDAEASEDAAAATESAEDAAAAAAEAAEAYAQRIEEMESRVESSIEGTEITESSIRSMVEKAVSYIGGASDNASESELAAYAGEYLYQLGKEKAPDHVLTTLGQKLYAYTVLITVDGVDSSSEEATAAHAEISNIIEENLGDDASIESQTATFYELVK